MWVQGRQNLQPAHTLHSKPHVQNWPISGCLTNPADYANCIADPVHDANCLAVHTALFAEPRGEEARAARLEESSGSCRNCRRVYSLLAGTAAVAADIT